MQVLSASPDATSWTRTSGATGLPAAADSARGGGTPWRWLILLTVLAVVTRAIDLDEGLWWDEIESLIESIRAPLTHIITFYPSNTQHPLYSVLAHLSIVTFGEHAWALRLPAFLLGVATVPALYFLGARVTTRREALLAAALLSVSYHHVWFSQNARGYSALVFLTVLATTFLLDGLRSNRLAPYIGYAVAVALAVYTHLTMVFVVLAHFLVVLWMSSKSQRDGEPRPKWQPALAGFVLAGAVSVLLYLPVLDDLLRFYGSPARMFGVATPGWALQEAVRMFRIMGPGAGIALGLGGLLFGAGLAGYFRHGRLAFLLFVLPGCATLVGIFATRATFYPRFFFFLAGFALLIVVRGALVCSHWVAARAGGPLSGTSLGTAVLSTFLVLSAASLSANYRYPKQDYEGALRFIESSAGPGELIMTAGLANTPFADYYGRPWPRIDNADELRAQPAGSWVVYTLPRFMSRGLVAELRASCARVRTFRGTVGGGDVIVCRLGAPAPAPGARVSEREQ